MFDWVETLSPAAGQLIGSFVGVFGGLLVILLGAMYNASLNRKRDDRLLSQEAASVAAAVGGELREISVALKTSRDSVKEANHQKKNEFVVFDIPSRVQIMPALIDKLGLLGPATVSDVINAYRCINIFTALLINMGGRIVEEDGFLMVMLPGGLQDEVIQKHEDALSVINRQITQLDFVTRKLRDQTV